MAGGHEACLRFLEQPGVSWRSGAHVVALAAHRMRRVRVNHAPGYASPEQRAGAPIAAASDVFSLGVLLHEVLAGCLPRTPVGAAEGAVAEPVLVSEGALQQATVAPPGRAVEARALRGDVDRIVAKAFDVVSFEAGAALVSAAQGCRGWSARGGRGSTARRRSTRPSATSTPASAASMRRPPRAAKRAPAR